jgi:hypothetical protein
MIDTQQQYIKLNIRGEISTLISLLLLLIIMRNIPYLIFRFIYCNMCHITYTTTTPSLTVIFKSVSDSCTLDAIISEIKPITSSGVYCSNTLTDDKFYNEEFDVVVANPPYGVSWKGYQKDNQASIF